jgi:multiple sugar transport system ATP-binding protein
LYGALDRFQTTREVTAKLPAHAPLSGIRAGEWHKFAVREAELRYFDREGRRTVNPKEQAR